MSDYKKLENNAEIQECSKNLISPNKENQITDNENEIIENTVSSVSKDKNFEKIEKQESDSTSSKMSAPAITPIFVPPTKSFWHEKPKVKPKADDDIEEFDTDEEEENEALKPASVPTSYTENMKCEGGEYIYIVPESGQKLFWSSTENKWCPKEEASTLDPMKNYEFDGKNYIYTDKDSNITYKFIQEKNEWVIKDKSDQESSENKDEGEDKSTTPTPIQTNTEGIYGFENDTHTYTDPKDGSAYIWDKEKNAWFPKVDDDFMARYQMSYGFTDNSSSIPKESESSIQQEPPKLSKEEKKAENKRKNQEPPQWFDIDESHNTTIYISNLPLDITMEELKELVCKCGLLARDEKGKDKLKLYQDSDGEIKGDARCTYIKVESVNLALNILDGWKIRDKTLSVQRAKFQLKGTYDPSLKPKKKKKDKEKQKKIHEKLFDWRPDRLRGEPLKCEKVVIIKNLFKPEDFDKDVTLLLEYQQDIRTECSKCGEVKKVTIYDRNPEGVAQVSFKEPEEAQACVQLLNNRWFAQRKITAEIWDGRTKYRIKETDEEIEARLNKWDKFLEEEDDKEKEKEKTKSDSEAQSTSTTQ